MHRCLTRLSVLACLSFFTEARADEAVDLFRRSETAYREQRYQEAAELLQKVYALTKDPVVLYNLARAYEGARADSEALAAYQHYLTALPRAPDAAAIERRISALKLRIADRQALEAQRDEERRRAEEQRQQAQAAELKAAHALAQTRELSPAPWIVAGGGALVLSGAVAFGIAALAKRDSAVSATSAGAAQNDLGLARTFATTANVSYAVGGAVTAAGLSWGLWKLATRDKALPVALSVGPGSLMVGGHF